MRPVSSKASCFFTTSQRRPSGYLSCVGQLDEHCFGDDSPVLCLDQVLTRPRSWHPATSEPFETSEELKIRFSREYLGFAFDIKNPATETITSAGVEDLTFMCGRLQGFCLKKGIGFIELDNGRGDVHFAVKLLPLPSGTQKRLEMERAWKGTRTIVAVHTEELSKEGTFGQSFGCWALHLCSVSPWISVRDVAKLAGTEMQAPTKLFASIAGAGLLKIDQHCHCAVPPWVLDNIAIRISLPLDESALPVQGQQSDSEANSLDEAEMREPRQVCQRCSLTKPRPLEGAHVAYRLRTLPEGDGDPLLDTLPNLPAENDFADCAGAAGLRTSEAGGGRDHRVAGEERADLQGPVAIGAPPTQVTCMQADGNVASYKISAVGRSSGAHLESARLWKPMLDSGRSFAAHDASKRWMGQAWATPSSGLASAPASMSAKGGHWPSVLKDDSMAVRKKGIHATVVAQPNAGYARPSAPHDDKIVPLTTSPTEGDSNRLGTSSSCESFKSASEGSWSRRFLVHS